jgi:hypothetical protein
MVRSVLASTKLLIGAFSGVCWLSMPVAGQAPVSKGTSTRPADDWKLPRTAWGHPDLQGVWTTDAEVSVPLERPRAFGERALLTAAELADRAKLEEKLSRDDPNNRDTFRLGPVGDGPEHWFEWAARPSARTSLVVDPPDGRLPPWTAEAEKRIVEGRRVIGYGGERAGSQGKGPFNGPEDLSLADRCVTRGLPTTWFPQVYNNGFQIVQSPHHVAIFYERLHEARVIPLDGRAHLTPGVRQWMGDSRGRFEGDTLVVDVTNFGEQTSFRRSGPALRLTERYTRVDADTVNVEITVEDPETWTRPWTVAVTGKKDPAYWMIYEYACHEGNYSLANMLSAARSRDNDTEAVNPQK